MNVPGPVQLSNEGLITQIPINALLLIVAVLLGSAVLLWLAGRKEKPVEGPGRLRAFLGSLAALDWSAEATPSSLEGAYRARCNPARWQC